MSEPVTVEQLDGILKNLSELDKKLDVKKLEMTELNKEYMKLEWQCVAFLTELKRSKYESPYGTFTVGHDWRVNMPADDKSKAELFEHLKQTPGLFERFATVNSASLNAYYKREWEIAKKEGRGMEFNIPGILAPKEEIKPKFKLNKNGEQNDE